jgi:hypothetical protein
MVIIIRKHSNGSCGVVVVAADNSGVCQFTERDSSEKCLISWETALRNT